MKIKSRRYSWLAEFTQVNQMPPSWSKEPSTFCCRRITKRQKCWGSNSFSRLFQCWILTAWSMVTIDATTQVLIWIGDGQIDPNFYIQQFITPRSLWKCATKTIKFFYSATSTDTPERETYSCMAVYLSKARSTSTKTTTLSGSFRIYLTKRTSASPSTIASSPTKRKRTVLVGSSCSKNLVFSIVIPLSPRSTLATTQESAKRRKSMSKTMHKSRSRSCIKLEMTFAKLWCQS